MGILKQLGTGQGFLKMGFLGFPKSGKTWTAMLVACGLKHHLGLDGPIAMFDTEGGSEYIAGQVKKRTESDMIGIRSRSFDDLMAAAAEAEGKVAVLIVDSVTHIWREVCDAYLKQVNEGRKAKAAALGHTFSPRNRLEFQDWNTIKAKWAHWTDFYLNSKMHIIICGRAGFEWDFEEDAETGKKELIKTGVKMKTESEFGFEPSLLVEMERIQGRSKGKLLPELIHKATVIGDRFGAVDGQSCDNPDFEFFQPHIDLLVPGSHAPIDTAVKSDLGVDEEGSDAWNRERKQRTILCEEIQGELTAVFPSMKAEDKKAKADMIHKVFGTRSWTKVEQMDSDRLRKGLAEIREAIHELPSEPVGA